MDRPTIGPGLVRENEGRALQEGDRLPGVDPATTELPAAFLALSGDRAGALSDLLRAAGGLRDLGEADGAQRAERAARRMTDLPIR